MADERPQRLVGAARLEDLQRLQLRPLGHKVDDPGVGLVVLTGQVVHLDAWIDG